MSTRGLSRYSSGPTVALSPSPARRPSSNRTALATTTNLPLSATTTSSSSPDPAACGASGPSDAVDPSPVGALGILRHTQTCRLADTGNSPVRQRLSTLASPLAAGKAQSPAGASSGAGAARAPLNATAPTNFHGSSHQALSSIMGGSGGNSSMPLYTNMSLDSALMGGLLAGRSNFLIPALVDTDADFVQVTRSSPASPTANVVGDVVEPAAPAAAAPGSPTTSTTPPTPPRTSRPPRGAVTVVWDLDETLCCNRRPGKAILRPGAIDVLRHLRSLSRDADKNCFVEIVLWTASMECVARPVVDRLDPHGDIFNHLIYRDRRWYKETGYTKDLKLLGRDMNRVVIIENSPMSVYLNRKHAILVRDFMGSAANDKDLFFVKQVLEGWITANGLGDDNAEGMPTGIVEFLTKHPAVSQSNEIIARSNAGVSTNSGYVASRFGGLGTSAVNGVGTMSYFGGKTASGIAKVPGGVRSPPAFRSSMYARRF